LGCGEDREGENHYLTKGYECMISICRVAELLRNGEGLSVEFKRCSGAVEHDAFETDGTTFVSFDCNRTKESFLNQIDCNL